MAQAGVDAESGAGRLGVIAGCVRVRRGCGGRCLPTDLRVSARP